MNKEPILRVESAHTAAGELVGYRLTAVPGGATALLFADQDALGGFRVGDGFWADFGDRIEYTVVGEFVAGGV